MKRTLLIMTILSISVISTACISNFAIKELNNKAQDYLNNGDVENAICRLKSSLDLDSEIFETHYNLAIAYLAADNQEGAVTELQKVIKLKPDYNDAYYSLGLANTQLAFKLIDKEQSLDKNGNAYKLNQEELQNLSIYLNEAVDNFNKYISKEPKAENAGEVKSQIEQLSQELKKRSDNQLEAEDSDEYVEDYTDSEEETDLNEE